MRKLVVVLAVLAVALGDGMAQSNALDKAVAGYAKQERDLVSVYALDLDHGMSELKKKGDLDAYLVVEAERKRFDKEGTVPAPADAKDSFRPAADHQYKAKAELLMKYVATLDGMVKQAMAQDRMDEAKVAKAEKDKASFVLADVSTKLPKEWVEAKEAAVRSVQVARPAGKEKPVPEGAAEYGGHHYKVYADGGDWNKASFRCKALGGHLASIGDAGENAFVYGLMKGGTHAWIGASKDLGSWRWCVSERFEYQNWAPGEPNGGKAVGLKVCIYGDWSGNEPVRGKWDDRQADSAEVGAYVCEWDY